LTILKKEGKISSHITPQNHLTKRQWFPPMTVEDFKVKAKSFFEQKINTPLPEEELSEQVVYITQKMVDSFNTLVKAVYYQESSNKEIIHFFDIKKGLEAFPKFFEDIKKSPTDFIGVCTLNDLLKDSNKIVGITNSREVIMHIEGILIKIDLFAFLDAKFDPLPISNQQLNPLTELYSSLGITQYIDQEIKQKEFLVKLLATDNTEKRP